MLRFRRWKSATDSNRRRAFQGWEGVHLILANPPWRQLRERAQKIQGDKKHVEKTLSQSHCVAQFNTAQERQMTRAIKYNHTTVQTTERQDVLLSHMKRHGAPRRIARHAAKAASRQSHQTL